MTWDYEVLALPINESSAQHILNQYGQGGWELVSVTYVHGRHGCLAYLKRERTYA